MIFLFCPKHGESFGEPNIIVLVADGVRGIIAKYRESFPFIRNQIVVCLVATFGMLEVIALIGAFGAF